jgi:hypothetical protein
MERPKARMQEERHTSEDKMDNAEGLIDPDKNEEGDRTK